MARIRSPGYPNTPLPEVIEFAKRIHEEDRQGPVAREVAAQHMGFSGPSGASDRALSALMHYGLAEKVAKGEIRVTSLAVDILHPNSENERVKSLHEAGFSPELFKELRSRYPDKPPSLATLTSYLARINFTTAAINPASKAYLETCYFLQREGAYSFGEKEETAHETDSGDLEPKSARVSTVVERPYNEVKQLDLNDLNPNEINLIIRGGYVLIEAKLDASGLTDLEEKIKAIKTLVAPKKVNIMNSNTDINEEDI